MSYFHSKINLLPNYFKKIGLGLILLALLLKFLGGYLIGDTNKMLEHLYFSLLLLGLSIIGASKDKMEDELSMHIRLKAMFWAFFYIIMYVILNPIFAMVRGLEYKFTAETIVLQMLVGYLLMYYYQKRKA